MLGSVWCRCPIVAKVLSLCLSLSLSLSLDDLIMCNSSATVAAVLCFVADGYLTVSENT